MQIRFFGAELGRELDESFRNRLRNVRASNVTKTQSMVVVESSVRGAVKRAFSFRSAADLALSESGVRCICFVELCPRNADWSMACFCVVERVVDDFENVRLASRNIFFGCRRVTNKVFGGEFVHVCIAYSDLVRCPRTSFSWFSTRVFLSGLNCNVHCHRVQAG